MKMPVQSALFLFLLLSGLACRKDDGLAPGFDMLFQREFSIPAGIGSLDVHHFQLRNIPSNWDQYLNTHGKSEADITGVITNLGTLGGIFGDVDLSFIQQVSVRVYNESNPNDFVEIAYRDPAPFDTGNILPLIPSLADAKRFFKEPRFSIDVVLYLRGITQDQSDVRLDLTMRATF